MIGLSVAVKSAKVSKMLVDSHRKDIPAARDAAFKRAGKAAKTQITKRIAKGAKVPQKYVRGRIGVGVTRSRKDRKANGVVIYLRSTHINPAGTKKYPQALKTNYRITKSGHTGKGHGDFKAMGRTYSNKTHHLYAKRFPVPLILKDSPTGGSVQERIKLGKWAENSMKNTARRIVPQVFIKRFEHELGRRAKRRGAGI